jgi:hypothetical protein
MNRWLLAEAIVRLADLPVTSAEATISSEKEFNGLEKGVEGLEIDLP